MNNPNNYWFLVIGLILFFFEDYPIISRIIAGLILIWVIYKILRDRRAKYKDIEDDLDIVETKSKYTVKKSKDKT